MTNCTDRISAIAAALAIATVSFWTQASLAAPDDTNVLTSTDAPQEPHARSVRRGLKLDPVAPLQGVEQKQVGGPSPSILGPLRDGPARTAGPDRVAGPAWTMGPLKVAGPAQLDGPLAASGPITK